MDIAKGTLSVVAITILSMLVLASIAVAVAVGVSAAGVWLVRWVVRSRQDQAVPNER
jgi:MFS superfamily sulfate permease-like transporter